MGYSEILCTICGVSFNIARIRRKDEPTTAAWNYVNEDDSFVEADEPHRFEDCGKNSGCTYYSRELDDGVYKSPWRESGSKDIGDADDDENVEGLIAEYESGTDPRTYIHPLPSFKAKKYPKTSTSGYSGHAITVSEMQGITTFQCLIRKRKNFQPTPDDTNFEKSPDFPMYLSGLCDSMPDRELANIETMYPMRHNMQSHSPDDICWGGDGFDEPNENDTDHFYSMPFHPSCLEIYTRASRSWFDEDDNEEDYMLGGLLSWWRNNIHQKIFSQDSGPRSRCGEVGKLNEQWWSHENGTEYIAANPLFIPNLAKVIADATTPHPIDGNSGAFDLPKATNFSPSPGDLFATLPAELRLNILTELSSEDLCNLRLVSRSFRQLPLTLYHEMLMKNMKFFWEAWPARDQTPYPYLATTTAERVQKDPVASRKPMPVPNQLDLSRTNWYRLYYGLRRGIRTGELKGLVNRSRIWEDCESILESIVEHWNEWEEERNARKANS
ncbi:hypothetical protein CBER1_00109 [Cercospora berteroae]|uniref:F-box domain-containing protein n=1 Tax=Cercospora berteroae TaxID=357750 RepID=A0A2S6CD52_9PEZI|nr:hypothetical protein CBER1_00109 [Cercospora berteroae]